jgi:methylphosphotriester-DNA--protein-cysteine methyltransferase
VVEDGGTVGRGRRMERSCRVRSGETVAAKRVGALVLPLAAGMRGCYPCLAAENDNQERRSRTIQKSTKCVSRNEKKIELASAADGEVVTMRSGRRVNDDTMGNLTPTTATFDVSLEDYQRRELGRAAIAWPSLRG